MFNGLLFSLSSWTDTIFDSSLSVSEVISASVATTASYVWEISMFTLKCQSFSTLNLHRRTLLFISSCTGAVSGINDACRTAWIQDSSECTDIFSLEVIPFPWVRCWVYNHNELLSWIGVRFFTLCCTQSVWETIHATFWICIQCVLTFFTCQE